MKKRNSIMCLLMGCIGLVVLWGCGGSSPGEGTGGDSDPDPGDRCVESVTECLIPNGLGEITCANGAWSSCQVVGCDTGYERNGEECVPLSLTGTTVFVTDDDVNSVLANASCGDTIIFANGNYDNVNIDIENKTCSETEPLLFAAETIGEVTFSGSCSFDARGSEYIVVDGFSWVDASRSGHLIYLDDTNYSVLSNNTFIRSGSSNDVSGVIHLENNTHHNVFKSNYFEDLSSIGFQIRVWAGEGGNNQHNRFKHNHFYGSNFTSELIQLGNGMYDEGHANPSIGDPDLFTVVEHNLFENINYVAELISDKTSSNVHRHNTFRNVGDSITLRHGRNTIVDSNYFFGSRGIRIYDDNHRITNNYIEGSYGASSWSGIIIGNGETQRPDLSDAANHYPTRNTLIAFNTLVGVSPRHMSFGPIGLVRANNLEVVANIVINEDGEAFAGINNVGVVSFLDNIIFSSGTGVPGYTGEGVNLVDPQLEHDGTIYRLAASSPARDATSYPMAFDVKGTARNASPDIGALSYGGIPVYPPLTSTDTGPGVHGRPGGL